jgi:hypothetical protein
VPGISSINEDSAIWCWPHIPHLNAVILGESLATDEINFVLPNQEFATSANVV